MTKALEIQAREAEFVLQTYKRQPVVFVKGAGTRLEDIDGKVYLDFISGIGVSVLGHAHPALTAAVADQTAALIHTSNLYYHPLQGQVAARLATLSGLQRAFFCNSGTEAMEACLKFARRYWFTQGVKGRTQYVAFEHGFSGRSMGALSVTANPHYREPFEPLIPGVTFVAPGDVAALEAAVTDTTAAIVVEPIQGEGGVRIPPAGYLARVRALCTQQRVLLAWDEVQTGLGRTGRMFAFEHEGARPDVLVLGKALSGGMYPVSCIAADDEVMSVFTPGSHGSTYGGNPIAAAVTLAALDVIEDERLPERAARLGEHALARLRAEVGTKPGVREVRGRGLMMAIEYDADVAHDVAHRLARAGVLAKDTRRAVVRLMPPLVIEPAELDEALDAAIPILAKPVG